MVANIGVAVLGVMLGYLTHYLVRRDEKPGVEDLGIIVGVLLAGTAIDFVSPDNSAPNRLYWYAIGLGIGFFLYWLGLLVGYEKNKAIVHTAGVSEIQGNEQKYLDNLLRRRLPLFPFLKQRP